MEEDQSSDEVLQSVYESLPCRESQIRQLSQLLSPDFPSPQQLVIHGVESTGKTSTIKSILRASGIPHTLIQSRECITTRHLLERTLASAKVILGKPELDGRCESINAFVVLLQQILAGQGKFILVFDGIDRQREALPTLLPALARLTIHDLTVVFIVTTPRPHLFHRAIPHIHFPQYTRSEALSIVGQSSIDTVSDSLWLWPRFIAAVYDSLAQAAARDIPSFRTTCERLWPPFIQPILDGHYGAREFSKLMVKNKPLFQSETGLVDTPDKHAMHLPYYTAHLLLASYLASNNPPRMDIPLLSKTTAKRKRSQRKISRRLLGPQAFGLERLFAIYHAILGEENYKGGEAEVMGQFATLVGLRLILRAGAGDVLEGKWRCGVGWEFVKGVGRSCELDIEEFVAEN